MICAGIHHISDAVFLSAAEGLADLVGDEDIAVGRSSFRLAQFCKFQKLIERQLDSNTKILKVVPSSDKSERNQHQDCSESGDRSLQVEIVIVTFSLKKLPL